MAFAGIPVAALDFYEDPENDNSKAFWAEHKHVYDEAVKAPIEALATELAKKWGAYKMFRPYRDVRFSKVSLGRGTQRRAVRIYTRNDQRKPSGVAVVEQQRPRPRTAQMDRFDPFTNLSHREFVDQGLDDVLCGDAHVSILPGSRVRTNRVAAQ